MGCIFVVLILAFPRVVLFVLYFFTNYLTRVYHSLLILLLGFIFLPLTTLAYAWMVHNGYPIDGLYLIILVVTVIIDLGGLGGGEWHRRRW
jgi:hypothetical protein